MAQDARRSPHWVFEPSGLAQLFEALRTEGYTLLGPTVRDGAIIYDEVASPGDLPVGWTDEQEAGHYRLKRREDQAYFGFVVGPQSWKKYLFPPRKRLWRAKKEADLGFSVEAEAQPPQRQAFIGVRGCELAAMNIQDTVFTKGSFQDPHYLSARRGAFLVAVNCVSAAPTCFCTSMNTGPKARGGDLALTEVVTPERHFFLVTEASERGHAVMSSVDFREASEAEEQLAQRHESRAHEQIKRKLDTHGLKDIIAAAQTHPHWEKVAERCLSCANCTLVCPTCFCSSVEDVVDITGDHSERWRRWDSCFNQEFTTLHGRPVRSSPGSRYRQWMTHKLSTWHHQFDSSGCVGCGRCITWCPVGIDITAEATALRTAISD